MLANTDAVRASVELIRASYLAVHLTFVANFSQFVEYRLLTGVRSSDVNMHVAMKAVLGFKISQ